MPRAIAATRWRSYDILGGRVEVMTVGRGDPLLFLHGWGLSPRSYAAGLRALTNSGVRVIAPCLPGSGRSTPLALGADLDAYVDRVAATLEALDLEKPAFVVGHSFGGGVALRLAVRHLGLVRSLTLVNSVGGAPAPREGLADRSWLRWALGALGDLTSMEVVRSAPWILRDHLPNLLRHPMALVTSGLIALRASLADDAHELVAQGVPLLFVWGDRDGVVAPGVLADVAAQFPAEVIAGRHSWLLHSPTEFAELITNALTVHAMLERKQRGKAVVLPQGATLADLFPPERRRRSRFTPP
jgi:pimeloyl-ACP methyl ester carboxylesterase